ncbi:hypothetical protein GCU56_13390 [Geodermatophilus sabuli]|uniref:Uncharacterized protein n=1 Tax=Geodermatophilus sabuli TaxID=1564158 RepID=A0A7K3W246_9ACTN|nr:hypothetical protein [Geodermatophilus sabuli]NEK58862.1 hypothetical protein [Geodermatophilus sabuli]
MTGERDQVPPAPGADGRGASRRLLAWATVGCVVLAVLVPLVVRADRAPAPAPAATPPPTAASTARGVGVPAAADVLGLPTRGSLAGDPAFVAGVRQLPWNDAGAPPDRLQPDPGTRRVVFAGDVPGGRWALVAGRNPLLAAESPGAPPAPGGRGLVAAWFAGPPGATAEQMRLRGVPRGVAGDRPAALLDPLAGALVVLGAPGDVVEVSDHPVVSADGRVSRSYRPVAAPDGVAVVALPPAELPSVSAVAYQVVRDGALLIRTEPDPFPDPAAPPPPPVPIDYRRGLPSATGAQVAQRVAAGIVAQVGLPRTAVQVAAPWVGDVPQDGPGAGTVAVVTVTVPSGAVVVGAEWAAPADDGAAGRRCALAIAPAGFPLDRQVHALSCGAPSSTGTAAPQTDLVVVAPPSVATVRAHSAAGIFLAEFPAADGVVVAPFPRRTVTVEAITGGGVSLGRVRLLGQSADFGS